MLQGKRFRSRYTLALLPRSRGLDVRLHNDEESMIDPGLDGKVVLVTGGNSGIGAQVVRTFASHGACVVIHYLESASSITSPSVSIEHEVLGRSAAEEVLATVVAQGGEGIIAAADLMVAEEIPELFDAAEVLGPVAILVNNAAHCESPDEVVGATAGGLDRHFAVNARAAALLMREFTIRYQRSELTRGSIINVSTDAARAFATQIGYGASKAALEALTRSASIELGRFGITVNAVAPGPVQTGWITAELEEAVLPSIPLGRIGEPTDIADAIVFLASGQARWITGQIVQVAGGHAL
jgi:3-oxoacyl-[acyl-carrier protein] reductase